MKIRTFLIAAVAVAVLPVSAAQAAAVHVVAPGESLYSVAQVDGLSVDALAAANGLPPDSGLTVGQVLEIPPQTAYTSAPQPTYVDPLQSATPSTATAESDAAPASSVTSDASQNTYLTGTTSAASSSYGQPGGGFVSGADIADAAASEGVPGSLAQAIAWQESGFNNDEVSATGALGVMQLEPGTVDWINQNLAASAPINPADPADNIRGGALLLAQLLAQTDGDEAAAVADYYQGAASVAAHGTYRSTQQYVADVLALQQRFGG